MEAYKLLNSTCNIAIESMIEFEKTLAQLRMLTGDFDMSELKKQRDSFRNRYAESKLIYPGDNDFYDLLVKGAACGLSSGDSLLNVHKAIDQEFAVVGMYESFGKSYTPSYNIRKTPAFVGSANKGLTASDFIGNRILNQRHSQSPLTIAMNNIFN